MKIKIYGKAHLEGTSKKTNKPFNLNQIHYLAPARNVEGLSAQSVFLDPAQFPLDRITLGAEYDIEFDRSGYVVGLAPVTK